MKNSSSKQKTNPFSINQTGKPSIGCTKPRLMRQEAVQEEVTEPSCSSPKSSVRFLPTIPSTADNSVIIDDEEPNNEPNTVSSTNNNNVGSTFYTILQSGNTLTTLSSPKTNKLDKPP